MSVGSRIRELRESKKISRSEFADKLGVTIGAILIMKMKSVPQRNLFFLK